MSEDADVPLRGPRQGRAARARADSAAELVAANRTGSVVGSRDDPSMLLLRVGMQDHARARRRSVTLVQLPDDDRAEMEDCWKALEGDKDGYIEVKHLLKAADVVLGAGNYSAANIRRAFAVMDGAHSGQVDWIMYRAFMSTNWNAGKNADDAMWGDHRKQNGDDMLTVDGSMRLIDLIRAYRRRTLVERALKDAQGQLRVMQHKRDIGTLDDSEENAEGALSAHPHVHTHSTTATSHANPGHKTRRRSMQYDPDDVAGALSGGGAGAQVRRSQHSIAEKASGHTAPSRLRRAQEALGAAGADHPALLAEKDWPTSVADLALSDMASPSGTDLVVRESSMNARMLPPIAVTTPSIPSSPLVSPIDAAAHMRYTRASASSSVQPSTPSSPLTSPAGLNSNPNSSSQLPKPRYMGRLGSSEAVIGGDPDPSSHVALHSNTEAGKRGGTGAAKPLAPLNSPAKKAPGAVGQPAAQAPAKQDGSSGFGRLAKFFWKSSSEPSMATLGDTSHRNRLPKLT